MNLVDAENRILTKQVKKICLQVFERKDSKCRRSYL